MLVRDLHRRRVAAMMPDACGHCGSRMLYLDEGEPACFPCGWRPIRRASPAERDTSARRRLPRAVAP